MPRIVVGEGVWEGKDSTVRVYALKDGDFAVHCVNRQYSPPNDTKLIFGAKGLDGLLLAVAKAKKSKRNSKFGYVLPSSKPEMVWVQVKPSGDGGKS